MCWGDCLNTPLAGLVAFPILLLFAVLDEEESLRKNAGMAGIKLEFATVVICSGVLESLLPLPAVEYDNIKGTGEFVKVMGKFPGNFKSLCVKQLKFLAEQYNWHEGKISLWRLFIWLKKLPVDFVVPEIVPKQVVHVACIPPGVLGWGCILL